MSKKPNDREVNLVRKIKLIYLGDKEQRIYTRKRMTEISQELALMGNKLIRHHVNIIMDIEENKKNGMPENDARKLLTDKFDGSLKNSGYRQSKEYEEVIPSVTRAYFNQDVFGRLNKEAHNIRTAKVSIPSYKKDGIPIPFDLALKVTEKGEYVFNFPGTIEEYKKKITMPFQLYFGKDTSNNRVIVERILSGEYKLSRCSIEHTPKDTMLCLTFSLVAGENPKIDPNKVMGIDMGINRPVTFYVEGEYNKQIITGEKMHHEKMKLLAKRRKISSGAKYNRGCHGRKRKTTPILRWKEQIAHFSTTTNHTISAELIDIAVKKGVGKIRMEDLTGITKNANEQFFKCWKYYELQNFIAYKAKMAGILVEWVLPHNTSKECPTCNEVRDDNRNKDNVRQFSCKNPQCKDHNKIKDADLVAAINISRKEGIPEKGKHGKKYRKNLEKLQMEEFSF